MTTKDATFAGSIPAIYEELLVPMIFQPYAEDLAARCRGLAEGTLLEIAAGTGAVTRELVKQLPAAVRILATDLNPGMLQVAASRVQAPAVVWQQADAQQLPLADASVALAVCQFGMMFMPDKVAAYREVRRVLSPRGRFLFNVWNRIEENEVTFILQRSMRALFASDPPQFLERTPFGYFDAASIRDELERAGFARVKVDVVEKVTLTSAREAAFGLCQGTPLRAEIESRNAQVEEATDAVTQALVARFGASTVENRMSALVIEASAA